MRYVAMQIERQTIRFGEGLTLTYFEAGRGPDLLLIHGTILTADDMRLSLLEPLASHFRVIAADRPGHGGARRPRLNGAPQDQARLLMEGARALGLQRPLLVGHSLGATVALNMALLFPDEVAGVVAIAPLAFPEPRLESVIFGGRGVPGLGELATFLGGSGPDTALLPALWRGMFLPQDMPERFRREFPFDDVRKAAALRSTGEDSLAVPVMLGFSALRYPFCRVPVSIIAGEADIVVNPTLHARLLARALPRSRLTMLPGMGHMSHHFCSEQIAERTLDLARAA